MNRSKIREILPINTILILSLLLLVIVGAYAQTAPVVAAPAGPAEFLRSLTGEWVGWCDQSTNGDKAECKYFHASMSQSDPTTFSSKFEYYRTDPSTHTPTQIGSATVTSTVQPDGSLKNSIAGEGTILVQNDPKSESHKFEEMLSGQGGKLDGNMTGSIDVSGLPMGLGKNGRVHDSSTSWSLNGGVLTIDQNFKVGFKVLLFTKDFTVTAHSTATRGTDVASLMLKHTAVASKPDPSSGG